jgi:ribose 5-phosphate isomerase
MFLTDEELLVLTGYRQHSKQVAELRRQGVPFNVNAAGRPAVARAVLEGAKQQATIKQSKGWEPKWAA